MWEDIASVTAGAILEVSRVSNLEQSGWLDGECTQDEDTGWGRTAENLQKIVSGVKDCASIGHLIHAYLSASLATT